MLFCSDTNSSVQYERNRIKAIDHRIEFIFGAGGAFSWIKDRHEGLPITPGCATEAISLNSLKGSGETLLLRGVIGGILAWMGANIGPNPNQTNPLGWV